MINSLQLHIDVSANTDLSTGDDQKLYIFVLQFSKVCIKYCML